MIRAEVRLSERIHGGALHYRARSGFAGPDFKLVHGLFEKHLKAGNDRPTLSASTPPEFGFQRIVDHVENDIRRNGIAEEALVRVRKHAEWRGMHQGIEMTRFGLFSHQGLSAADFGQGSNPV